MRRRDSPEASHVLAVLEAGLHPHPVAHPVADVRVLAHPLDERERRELEVEEADAEESTAAVGRGEARVARLLAPPLAARRRQRQQRAPRLGHRRFATFRDVSASAPHHHRARSTSLFIVF